MFFSLAATQAAAHPDHKSDDIQLAVYKWVNATFNGDINAIEELASEDFKGPDDVNRQAFLDGIKKYGARYNINLDKANYNRIEDTIHISDVIVDTTHVEGMFPSVYSLVFFEVMRVGKLPQ